jgi:hypothetical protein
MQRYYIIGWMNGVDFVLANQWLYVDYAFAAKELDRIGLVGGMIRQLTLAAQ